MSKVKFTLAEALDALEQNNIPIAIGTLTTKTSRVVGNTDVIGSACALGQCAINLGVHASALETAFGKVHLDGITLAGTIIRYNDTYKHNPSKVAKLVRERLTPEQLDQTFELESSFSIVVLKSS